MKPGGRLQTPNITKDLVMAGSRALLRYANNGFGSLILAGLLPIVALAHMWTDAPMMRL